MFRLLAGLALVMVVASPWACGDDAKDPRIETVLPDHGQPGDTVDVVGERFAGSQRQVSFGGQPASVVWQDQRARVTVPDLPAGLTLLVVTVDGRPSNAVNFRVE